MKKTNEITVAILFKKMPERLKGHGKVIFLTSLLYGITSTVVSFPATKALLNAFQVSEISEQAATDAFWPTIFFAAFLSLFFNSLLLVPVTRLLASRNTRPLDGFSPFPRDNQKHPTTKYFRMVARIFGIQVTALALIVFTLLALVAIVFTLSGKSTEPMSTFGLLFVVGVAVLFFTVYSVMHMVISAEIMQRSTPFKTIWKITQQILPQLAMTYAMLKLASFILSFTAQMMISALFSGTGILSLASIIGNSIDFAVQIFHFSICIWALDTFLRTGLDTSSTDANTKD